MNDQVGYRWERDGDFTLYVKNMVAKKYTIVFYFSVHDSDEKSTISGVAESDLIQLITDFKNASTSTQVLSVIHSTGMYAVKSYLVHEIYAREE